MKKIGKYLKCVLPLLVMLGIQLFVSAVLLIRYILAYGLSNGTEVYLNDTMEVLLISDLLVLLVFLLWYFLSVRRHHKKMGDSVKSYFEIRDLGKILALAVGMQCMIGIFLGVWSILSPSMINEYDELMDASGIISISFLSIITSSIIGPIEEELVFRGVTTEYLKRAGASFWILNILQALLFGIAHLNLVQGCYAFFVGLVCGYLALRYRSLFPSIVFHILFNAYNYLATVMAGILEWIPDIVMLLVYTVGGVWLMVWSLRSIHREIRSKEEAENKEAIDIEEKTELIEETQESLVEE